MCGLLHRRCSSGIALTASLFYISNFDRMTFAYPRRTTQQERYIAGTELTPMAAERLKNNPGTTRSELVFQYGGIQESKWCGLRVDPEIGDHF